MTKQDVDDYLAHLEALRRQTLETLRRSILAEVPDAEEGLSYGAPASRIRGKVIAGFVSSPLDSRSGRSRDRPFRWRSRY